MRYFTVLSIEDVWVIPLLRGDKITIKLSLKYAKLSVKLFYENYQGEFINTNLSTLSTLSDSFGAESIEKC